MRKGFTLIELLAVIVILAIIALIATPIVLNIIEDSKESAVLRSAEFYMEGVEQSIATATLKNATVKDGKYSIMEDGNICIGKLEDSLCKEDENIPGSGYVLEVNVNGEKPKEGTIKIKNGQIEKADLKLSEKEVWTDPFTGDLAYKLAPGLYDKKDELIMSWDELNKFTLDKTNNEYDFNDLIEQGEVEIGEDDSIIVSQIIDSIENAYKLVIDESVTSIETGAFTGCTSLTSIIIPESVKSIGEEAFNQCTSLTNVIIEEGVKTIDYGVFLYCVSLTNIIIPESVKSIGEEAFNGCTNLTSITIPSSVTYIGVMAFASCEKLTSITIPSSVTSIGDDAFNGCTNLTSITIPSSVTSIGSYAFAGCTSLTSITIPSSVTSIGWYAFEGCESLTSVIIPESVTSIEENAFAGCTSLTSITIPSSVTSIGEYAFSECTSLTTINYTGTKEQWNAIVKDEYWDDGTPSNKVINYNYTE